MAAPTPAPAATATAPHSRKRRASHPAHISSCSCFPAEKGQLAFKRISAMEAPLQASCLMQLEESRRKSAGRPARRPAFSARLQSKGPRPFAECKRRGSALPAPRRPGAPGRHEEDQKPQGPLIPIQPGLDPGTQAAAGPRLRGTAADLQAPIRALVIPRHPLIPGVSLGECACEHPPPGQCPTSFLHFPCRK